MSLNNCWFHKFKSGITPDQHEFMYSYLEFIKYYVIRKTIDTSTGRQIDRLHDRKQQTGCPLSSKELLAAILKNWQNCFKELFKI